MCMVFCVCHVSIDMKPAILENVYLLVYTKSPVKIIGWAIYVGNIPYTHIIHPVILSLIRLDIIHSVVNSKYYGFI